MFWMIILGIIIKGDVPLNHDGEGLFYEIKYRESEGSFEWDRERLSNFLDRLKEIGIKYYRLHLRWDVVQPDSLIYDFSFYDTLISNLKRRGIEPFITFQGCPWWASKANDPIANPRARKAFDRYAPKREYYDEFKRFLKKVLEHYSSQNTPENIKVRYYEHFNEPEAFWRRIFLKKFIESNKIKLMYKINNNFQVQALI